MQERILDEIKEVKSLEFTRTDKRALADEIDALLNVNPDHLSEVAAKIRELLPHNGKLVFVSGNFNVVHPGHLRLLNFASECGDLLVVGVVDDAHPGSLVPQALRLEAVRAIDCVDLALALHVSTEKFIAALKPEIVVKGNEHEQHFNSEQPILEEYGGKLVFSSGETRFSSLELLRAEMQDVLHGAIKKPAEYLQRHGINAELLPNIIHRFQDLNVVVLGDLIVDEYVTCDPLGLSREDPTIVVTPIKKDVFIGGAGIVAAHASSLGAKVRYFSIVGADEAALYAAKTLDKFNVDTFLLEDDSRPTTLKQRYRADNKTLLRVSHLRHHHIENQLVDKMLKEVVKVVKDADLVVFSDFNYGCLPQPLVDAVIDMCNRNGVPMVADSQSSSQIGDVSRFHGMKLITPTEYEARLAVRDQSSGLISLAEKLAQKARAEHIFITLGAEGVLVHSPHGQRNQLETDQLPAMNSAPKDVSGGGDTLLICTSLALATGASIWESAYLGSLAAACHVARMGNMPLSADELLQELYV